MLKCLLKYHFVRLFHVASGSSHKSYKGGHHSEDQAAGVSQDKGQEGRGHFSRSQEGSSMRVPLATTVGEGNLSMPYGLHRVRVVYLCNPFLGRKHVVLYHPLPMDET